MKVIDSLVTQAAGIAALRREIHAHPELCFEEVRTADLVAGADVVISARTQDQLDEVARVWREQAVGLERALDVNREVWETQRRQLDGRLAAARCQIQRPLARWRLSRQPVKQGCGVARPELGICRRLSGKVILEAHCISLFVFIHAEAVCHINDLPRLC